MAHSTAEIRAALFNRKLRELPVDFVIDGLEDYTGELSVIEVKATDSRWAEKAAEESDGTMNETLMMAGIVIKGLYNRETKERIFQDNDLGSVAEMGLSVLKPISDLITEASGLGPNALAAAKKNLPTTQKSDSGTSLPQNSDTPPVLTTS